MAHTAPHPLLTGPLALDARDLPGIQGGGYWEFTRRSPQDLGDHAHADGFEIHYLTHGQIDERVAGTSHIMDGGDVMVAAPGVAHSGINRVRHRCGLCWLNLHLPPGGTVPGLTRAMSARIRRALVLRGSTPFPGDPALLPAFAGLLSASRIETSSASSTTMRELICRAYLHLILGLITRGSSVPGEASGVADPAPTAIDPAADAPQIHSPEVAQAITLLGRNLGQPLRIADLPTAVGLRRTALYARFVAETGMTPAEYRMQLRLEEAKRLLAGPAGMVDNQAVAARLGFATPQHLITMFRRAFNVTPAAWRAASARGKTGSPG
jgi:AraC-like DNA-binding protein